MASFIHSKEPTAHVIMWGTSHAPKCFKVNDDLHASLGSLTTKP